MPHKQKHFYEFEGFRLDAENPSLWRGGEMVSIPPKALETLILLVARRGEIVSRDDLLDTVWKDTFVEEGNINYTISLLRKTLGDKDLIQTVPRRGYRIAADIREVPATDKTAETNSLINEKTAETVHEKPRFRWIFGAIVLISALFLTSFAFWWRGETPKTKNPATANVEAMQAYKRGQMIFETKNAERRQERAIDEFQRAITLDPTFAPAYVGLGEGFAALAIRESYPTSRYYLAKARAAADKALTLDPNLAEAFALRGWLKRNADWDFAGAETDLRRAIRLNGKNAMVHYRLAYVLTSTGRQNEALAEINTAYELDPISDFTQAGRFPILEARGEYDEALRLAEDFLRENKENTNAKRAVATFLFHKKEFKRVIELGEQALGKDAGKNAFPWFSLLAAAYLQTNETEKAEETLKKLESLAESDTKALYSLAMNYAELNRADEAFAALEKCLEMREERMVWLAVEPRFINLKNDSRFRELLQKTHLI